MYNPEITRELLTLGNNLARQCTPDHDQHAELIIPFPNEGWLFVLSRSNLDALTSDGFMGDFDQLQAIAPRVPTAGDQSRDIIVSTGEGVDPSQHPFRARLPEQMQSQLADGDVAIMSVLADEANDMPIEGRANEVLSVVDGLITVLGQLAAQNTAQNNVQ